MTWCLKFFAADLKQVLTYRVEFWLQFFFSIGSQFAVAYFVWKSIYAHRGEPTLEGYTFGALMAFYLLAPLFERVVQGGDYGQISREIYEGSLSRYLVYPVSFFGAKFMSHLAQSTLALAQLAAVLLALALLVPGSLNATPAQALVCCGVIVCAIMAQFALTACLEQLAFWADNVWSLLVMSRIILHLAGGSLLPLAFFPPAIADFLSYLPFHCFIDLPSRLMLGRATVAEGLQGMAVALVWSAILGLVANHLWRRGLLRYSGAGM
jgi:ABC-2 type transport system permease protein